MTFDPRAWEPDPALKRELEEQFARTVESYQVHPDLISEHANHEESIRTGGYASRTLLELVQNAADALTGAESSLLGRSGRVEIVLDTENRALYCANAGRPFSKSGLTAVTMAYLSAKRGDEIGRFGLGFKSVLAVTNSPQVFSRSISFEFNSPLAREALQRVARAPRYPILRTATPLDARAAIPLDPILAELAGWATTIVKLPDIGNVGWLRAEIEDFSSEFLLFVESVREIRLRVVGDQPSETTHVSRDLGDGRLRIERPDGGADEWLVSSAMHRPSAEARKEVGEAVSRPEVKVTVALPAQHSRLRIGQFWSYFRLQDRTSASALFNAPWSVNDDRTNLLDNLYNREILKTVSELFVNRLQDVRTEEDPAVHFDYLPARGRGQESHGFADEVLSARIITHAGARALIPDSHGTLRNGRELRPVDFQARFSTDVHKAWANSPNTGDDVPHWRCYGSATRATRLRDLFIAAYKNDLDPSERDALKILEQMPQRGLLSWLREWAEGTDMQSAANALRVVVDNPKMPNITAAKVIPTTAGMRSLDDRATVFLRGADGIEIEGAQFVLPAFLAERGIEDLLRRRGFRDLDPEAVLRALIAQLGPDPEPEALEALWDAALEVAPLSAAKVMSNSDTPVKVPTRDGGWAWPGDVVDLPVDLPDHLKASLLDRQRCVPQVAHRLGVVTAPERSYLLDSEAVRDEYLSAAVAQVNSRLGPGERPVERAEVVPGQGPGPVSVLAMLHEGRAPENVIAEWTSQLLALPDTEWELEDLDSRRRYVVEPPAVWAARKWGLVPTTQGLRRPADAVSPVLVQFGPLLPLFKGPREVHQKLRLPDELGAVPSHVFEEALGAQVFPSSIADDVLAEFVLTAARVAYPGSPPPRIPARVNRVVEGHPPAAVYLASTEEEAAFLASHLRPFLRVSPDQVEEFVAVVGCRRFADSFSFAMVCEGADEPRGVLDAFTGLRLYAGHALGAARFARAMVIAKRVVTEDGAEDQPQDWYRDGDTVYIRSDADDHLALKFISEAFELHLDNAQIAQILKAGLELHLESQREQARAIESDAERLEVYIGPDDLKDALPTGLWSALEAQGLVNDDTSVAELFLTVWGSDSLKILADRFRELGYTDVPTNWAGSADAISWVRKMGFGTEFAGQRNTRRPAEFVVPGAVKLNSLHKYQKQISEELRTVLTLRDRDGRAKKAMVVLPTGSGKTRVATETVLRLFADDVLSGTVLWIAQSEELCEQAVQTFRRVWAYLEDERPLSIGRLWGTNTVHEPQTEFAVIVATDAKIERCMELPEYGWLRTPTAVFVDEAHRAGTPRYTEIFRWLGVDGRNWERPLVGLSATPFKGRAGEHSGTAELAGRFGHNLIYLKEFENPHKELVKRGVLANVQHEVLQSGVDIERDIDVNRAEMSVLREKRLIDRNVYEKLGRNERRMKALAEHIMTTLKSHPEWPVLVFTPSVVSAQVLAASLRYRGVASEAVSGEMGNYQRRRTIERFQRGDIQVLTNCDLLVQGFDAPGVRALYIARPTFSPGAYIQMAGRGLRGPENGGKEECLIVDVEDNWGAMNDFLGYREYEYLWKEQQV